jgi:hypothetical protein
MSDGMGEVRLDVDGAEVPLGSVWVHHQSEPYPGGLRYRLIVPRGMAAQWVGNILGRGDEGIDERRAREMLFLIAGMLSWVRHEATSESHRHEAGLTHVLNTIDSVAEGESYLTIGGVCSPFLKDSK